MMTIQLKVYEFGHIASFEYYLIVTLEDFVESMDNGMTFTSTSFPIQICKYTTNAQKTIMTG